MVTGKNGREKPRSPWGKKGGRRRIIHLGSKTEVRGTSNTQEKGGSLRKFTSTNL